VVFDILSVFFEKLATIARLDNCGISQYFFQVKSRAFVRCIVDTSEFSFWHFNLKLLLETVTGVHFIFIKINI
jgi:hypothetical protein